MMNERLGRIHFAFTYFGFLFTFFPMHIVGMLGMPRRVAVYDPNFTDWNQLISFSAFVLGFSTFIVIYNVIQSYFHGPVAGANPWRALTLEWATTSPPPVTNFADDPIPFEDPYGYGTEASAAYLDAVDAAFSSGRPAADGS